MQGRSSTDSRSLTIDLGPTFGSNDNDVDRVRNGQINLLDGMQTADLVFAFEIPLEVVGIATNQPTRDNSSVIPPSSLSFIPSGDVTVRGMEPNSAVRDLLLVGGEVGTSVDSLSRSILLSDIDEHTLIDALRSRADLDTDHLEALKSTLLVPSFYDDLDETTADRAQRLLTENLRRHERSHVNCLINPETVLWREIELYWRSVLVGAKPQTWEDSSFLQRFARLYTIPSHFMVELLAMLTEDYTGVESDVQRAVKKGINSRRGVTGALMRFIEDRSIDPETLQELLRSPVGEQFCDLWLAYVLDKLRSGSSLSEIDAAGFHDYYSTSLDASTEMIDNSGTRAQFTDFIRERCFGPVFEVVRLDFVDEQFVLKRTWYSLNPEVSDAGNRLAVRRALYRRRFLTLFGAESGLNDARAAQERAVERVVRGASLEDVTLADISLPSPEQLSASLAAAHESAATALLGSQATSEDLHRWLNEPETGTEKTSRI